MRSSQALHAIKANKSVGGNLLSVTDVATSSVMTMLITLLAAKCLSVAEFGAFGVLLLVASLGQSVVQGAYCDVILRQQNPSYAIWAVLTDRVVGGSAFLIAGAGLLIAPAVPVVSWCLVGGAYLIGVSRTLIFRAAMVQLHKQILSLAASLAALLAIAGLVAILPKPWHDQTLLVIVACCVMVHTMASHVAFAMRRREKIWSPRRERIWRWDYALESVIMLGVFQMVALILTPRFGLNYAAGYRGSTLLLGLITLSYSAVQLVWMPRLAGMSRARRPHAVASLLVLSSAAVYVIVAGLALYYFGWTILGESAGATSALYPFVAFGTLTQTCWFLAYIALRAKSLDRYVREGRTVLVAGAVLAGAVGLISGLPKAYLALLGVSQLLAAIWAALRVRRIGVAV